MAPWEEGDEVVVLVVGDDPESKAQIANRVAKLYEASPSKPTIAGVRIFSSTANKKVIVDTVSTGKFPAVGEEDLSQDERNQIARQWISQNSLRRLVLDKFLYVVCALTCPKGSKSSLAAYEKKFGWLETLGLIFQEHKKAIQIVVNTQHIDEDERPSATKNIGIVLNERGFTSSNTKYLDWSNQADELGEQFKVEDCVRLEGQSVKSEVGDNVHRQDGTAEEIAAPFVLQELASPRMDQCPPSTPWDPERVILFGRTGSGKSTLAQMLTKGKLDPVCKEFGFSSGIRGETKEVSSGQGRGWYVVDTPGFGEPNRSQSTVPTQVAEEKIKKFVRTIDGLFSHFLFVVKKDRIDELEIRLWRFFVRLFGHNEINDHFSIVITNADDDWVKMNETYLREMFKGCGSFLCAEFPSPHSGDDEWEEELQEIRNESLERMEEALANLSRKDIICEFGDLSKTARMSRQAQRQGHGRRDSWGDASVFFLRIFATMSCLTETLTIDRDIALLPF